jgi:hypothetical protein
VEERRRGRRRAGDGTGAVARGWRGRWRSCVVSLRCCSPRLGYIVRLEPHHCSTPLGPFEVVAGCTP